MIAADVGQNNKSAIEKTNMSEIQKIGTYSDKNRSDNWTLLL